MTVQEPWWQPYMDRLRKPRFLFVYVLVPFLFLGAKTTEAHLRLGLMLAFIGEFIRLWANGYVGHVKVNSTQTQRGDAKVGRLITGGPYAYVRHPLYFGTLLIGAGFFLVVGSFWLSLAGLAAFLMIYSRKMTEEEVSLKEECGTAYAAYAAAVPRWLPTFSHYANPEGRWTWQGVAASKEWKTLIWVTVTALVLYIREEAWQEHEFLTGRNWVKHAVVLLVLIMLVAGDGLFELFKRRSKRLVFASGGR